MPDRILESNKESNALAQARNRKKCHSYSVECNTTRIDRSKGKGDDLTTNQRDYSDSIAINRPCVAHQICRRARAPIDTTIEIEGVRIGVQLTNGIRLLD
jgi:hypothetical protein